MQRIAPVNEGSHRTLTFAYHDLRRRSVLPRLSSFLLAGGSHLSDNQPDRRALSPGARLFGAGARYKRYVGERDTLM
jgi:hypothetical protein